MAEKKLEKQPSDLAIVLSQREGDIQVNGVTLKFGETVELPRVFAEELVARYKHLKIVR